MKITLITVGKLKEKYLKLGIEEYAKRLSAYCKLSFIEIADEKAPENLSMKEMDMVKAKEGQRILAKIKPQSYVIALAIEGKTYTSEQLSQHLSHLMLHGKSDLIFIIGGSLGLHEAVIQRADENLSFSKMTFPHQLMKLILVEQLYRSYKIIEGSPYHK